MDSDVILLHQALQSCEPTINYSQDMDQELAESKLKPSSIPDVGKLSESESSEDADYTVEERRLLKTLDNTSGFVSFGSF